MLDGNAGYMQGCVDDEHFDSGIFSGGGGLAGREVGHCYKMA